MIPIPKAEAKIIAGIDTPVVTAIGAAANALIPREVPAVNGAAIIPAAIAVLSIPNVVAPKVVIFFVALKSSANLTLNIF